jgi:hypothetical protein
MSVEFNTAIRVAAGRAPAAAEARPVGSFKVGVGGSAAPRRPAPVSMSSMIRAACSASAYSSAPRPMTLTAITRTGERGFTRAAPDATGVGRAGHPRGYARRVPPPPTRHRTPGTGSHSPLGYPDTADRALGTTRTYTL